MKRPALLLAGSLAVNAALATVWVFRGHTAEPTDHSPTPATPLAIASSDPRLAEHSAWAALRGDEADGQDDAALTTFVSRLREAGFPPMIVRLLVKQAVRQQFAERRQAIFAAAKIPSDFWSPRFDRNGIAPETRAALRDLAREERGLCHKLLGEDYDAGEEHRWADQRRRYGPLSAEKIERLQDLQIDYSDLRNDVTGGDFNILTPAIREKLAFLDLEMRRDLAELLTPEELAEHEMRTSPSMWSLRNSLGDIDLSEQEFRSVFSLRKAFDDRFMPSPFAGKGIDNSPEEIRRRGEAEQALHASIRELLGEPRASEYERRQDHAYRNAVAVVEQLGLPKQAAIDVYALQKDTMKKVHAIQSDRSLSSEQRNTRLTELAQEVAATLTQKLTPEGFQAYKNRGGHWTDSFRPRQAIAQPAATTMPASRSGN